MTVPAGPYLPTNGKVAVAFLGSRFLPSITPGMVATSLPRELSTWADLGFVQATIVAASPDVDVPVRRPLVQLDAWAVSPDSVKPNVAKANRLAELVFRGLEDDVQLFGKTLDLGPHYLPVRVLAAYPSSEPAEVPDDPSGYGRVTFDFVLEWARL